jgi:predicted RNA-binding protein with EMAP domain
MIDSKNTHKKNRATASQYKGTQKVLIKVGAAAASISKRYLRYHYIKKGKSLEEIANLKGVALHIIKYLVKKYDLLKRKYGVKKASRRYTMSLQTRLKIQRKKKSIGVVQIDPESKKVVNRFYSIRAAAAYFGCDKKNIKRALRNIEYKSMGFGWQVFNEWVLNAKKEVASKFKDLHNKYEINFTKNEMLEYYSNKVSEVFQLLAVRSGEIPIKKIARPLRGSMGCGDVNVNQAAAANFYGGIK